MNKPCVFFHNSLVRYTVQLCLCFLFPVSLAVFSLDVDLLINGPSTILRLLAILLNRRYETKVADEDQLSQQFEDYLEDDSAEVLVVTVAVVAAALVLAILAACFGSCYLNRYILCGENQVHQLMKCEMFSQVRHWYCYYSCWGWEVSWFGS